MIEVEGLTHRYGRLTAVENLDLRVERGELLGLLGPNGAGKSTALRAIAGLLTPTEGEVRIGGHSMGREPRQARRLLGYLPENVSLYLELTVIEFLRFVGAAKGLGRSQAAAEADRVIPLAGLESVRNRVIGYCSRGYRQRVGLAQVLVGDPPALVLDEPTVGLDPAQIVDIRDRIAELAGDRAVILSTHILPEASRLCSKLLVLNRGRRVAFDEVSRLTRGGEDSVEIEVRGSVGAEGFAVEDGAPELMEVHPEGDHTRLVFRLPPSGAVGEVVAHLVGRGLSVEGVHRRQSGLEEVFLRLVHEDPVAQEGNS